MQFQESTYPQILSFTFLQHNISGTEVPTLFLFGISGMNILTFGSPYPFSPCTSVPSWKKTPSFIFLKPETSLHEPMYHFLSILIFLMRLSIFSLTTMLKIFLFNSTGISPDVCFAQMFYIYEFSAMESSFLFIMFISHFISIYNLLRYTFILTSATII